VAGRPNVRGVIVVEELSKRYGRTVAVDRLSFAVRPGCVTGFLGPNGAGKSTTMRMILGLDRPSGGTASIGHRPYHTLKHPLREVGAMLEGRSAHPGRRARHHLLYLARSNGIPDRRVHEVLELVGLADAGGRRARSLSLGMAQRLGLAAALLGDPPILLLDEPVNGLDPEGVHWLRSLLRTYAAQGRTVLVSSHLMAETALTADRLVVVAGGRLVADATVDEFVGGSPSLEAAFLKAVGR
jgi:ABC-2 type transport system ATP-binding protein